MENAPSGEGRMVMLRTGEWVGAEAIGRTLLNEDAAVAIRFYQRWKRLGMPYGPWGMNPEKLVEVVEVLEPLDRFYHPQMSI